MRCDGSVAEQPHGHDGHEQPCAHVGHHRRHRQDQSAVLQPVALSRLTAPKRAHTPSDGRPAALHGVTARLKLRIVAEPARAGTESPRSSGNLCSAVQEYGMGRASCNALVAAGGRRGNTNQRHCRQRRAWATGPKAGSPVNLIAQGLFACLYTAVGGEPPKVARAGGWRGPPAVCDGYRCDNGAFRHQTRWRWSGSVGRAPVFRVAIGGKILFSFECSRTSHKFPFGTFESAKLIFSHKFEIMSNSCEQSHVFLISFRS